LKQIDSQSQTVTAVDETFSVDDLRAIVMHLAFHWQQQADGTDG
jgi:hypothetical protein